VALLEKRRYLNNRSGDFPQVILIVPSHVPNNSRDKKNNFLRIDSGGQEMHQNTFLTTPVVKKYLF
jgi:hypothetical protein